MVESTDQAKESIGRAPLKTNSSPTWLLAQVARPSASTPHRLKGGVAATRRSVAAVSDQEMDSSLPIPLSLALGTHRDYVTARFEGGESTEIRNQHPSHIEGSRVDRTQVLHNLQQEHYHETKPSLLSSWRSPREHSPEFIRQSVSPIFWTKNHRRPINELATIKNEKDEAARVHRTVTNVLATAPPNTLKKLVLPRAPSSTRNQSSLIEDHTSLRKEGGVLSPRARSVQALSGSISSPTTSRSEKRIYQFIAELRADPALWAAFQHDVEQIQQQYRHKHDTCDKIRANKKLARTPRSLEDHELRKKQAADRMERTRHQRMQLLQLKDRRLVAKREQYLRRVNPSQISPSAEHEQAVRYRRRKIWLHVASLAVVSHRWHEQLVQSNDAKVKAKLRSIAASTIQRIWRKWKWQCASQHTVIVYTWLRKCLWKKLLELRCRRKARQVTLLLQFILDHCHVSRARRNINRLMLQWRRKVICAQRVSRSFVVCNRARLQALSIWFDNIDHERLRFDRQVNNEERRLTGRRDSINSNFASAPGSAGAHRSRTSSILAVGGMDEKRMNMQMLVTPIELQRLQQTSVQIVKIPKSIKWQLLTEFLAESRKQFQQQQRAYQEKIRCAVYAREVKLEEARAIVQGSMSWDKASDANISSSRSTSKAIQPPSFFLYSDSNGAKRMEDVVRRGVQLTLDADPELRALIARQQEHRVQSTQRRSSVSFLGAPLPPPAGLATSPTLSPLRRQSILKKPA